MRVFATSDLHLERRDLADIPPPSVSFDVLVCAGDVWQGEPERAVQSVVDYARGRPAIIVPGNHDLYNATPEGRRTIADVVRSMEVEAERQNTRANYDIIQVLSAWGPACEIDGVRFVGMTLWGDWMQAARWADAPGEPAEVSAARARTLASKLRTTPREYSYLRTERGSFGAYESVAEHARERAILTDELTDYHDGLTVVVTHHPPVAELIDAYRDQDAPWWAPAFYVSNLLPELPDRLRPDLWVCGHVHAPYDATFGRTRVICNPVEGGQYNPSLVIEV
jgi:Icc-related predicted phosphoesterase